jgi:uncharacterized repeat protein (TIGR01451 family)
VTYLGGDGTDEPVGIRVDGRGDPFVAGTTSSTNFPTIKTTAYQPGPETGTHVFVTELQFDATALLYSSYLAGNGTDTASGMTIDASGNLYVTGTTTSSDVASTTDQFPASTLPEALPYQSFPRAPLQFFVTKVFTTARGTGSIAYSTYFGGGSFDTTTPVATGGGIAVDTNGIVYFTGTTNFTFSGTSSTTDFPILNAYQPCLDQAPPSVVVTNPTCSTTTSTTEPDAFVAKLNPNVAQGQQLVWSTYLGGSGTDSGSGIALDVGAANVYIVGTTNSSDIATSVATLSTSASFQRCLDTPINPTLGTACPTITATPPPNDAFVARLTNPTTTTGTTVTNVALNYFSYLGGSLNEAGLAITVDSSSGAVVTGWTQSPDFFVVSPIEAGFTGGQDAFMARLNTVAVAGQTTTGSWASFFGGSTADSGSVLTEGTGVALDVNQNSYFAGDTNSPNLQLNKPLPNATLIAGGYDAFVAQLGSALSLSISGVLTQGTNQQFIDAGNQATFTYTVTNSGPDLASSITFLDNLSPSVTVVPLTFISAGATSSTCGGGSTSTEVTCSLPSLQPASTATVTVVVTPTANSNGTPAAFNGGAVQAMGQGNIVLAQTSVPAQMSDFSLKVNPPNGSVLAAGDTAVYQATLAPNPVYSHGISLGCSGLPAGAGCNFTTQSVTLLGGPGSSTINITTTARPVVTPAASLLTRHFYAIWLALPGLTLLGVGAGSNRRRRRILGMLMFCALFALLLLQPACSGTKTQAPVSGTPAGIYTITVTATSGTDTKSQNITLSVP